MLAVGACAWQLPVRAEGTVCQATILSSYPNGTWLENIAQDARGRLYISVTSERKIVLYQSGTGTRLFANLPIYPMGFAILKDRLVVAGNRHPMSEGAPAMLTGNAIAEVSLAGKVLKVTELSEARMLNGVTATPDGAILVADSRGATIWRYDPHSGAATRWLKNEQLAAPTGAPAMSVGVNGLKFLGRQLFMSNTARGEILTVPVTRTGAPAGPISALHHTGIVDDFDIASDGTIIAAPYKNNVIRVSPKGAIDIVLSAGAEGATAISLIGPRAKPTGFYVLTTGNLLFGGKLPAKLLLVPLPGPAGCPR